MATLEEILKAKGYSDADLVALKPMLEDAKFRGAVEDFVGSVEARVGEASAKADSWEKWYNDTGLPTVDQALQKAQDEAARAASAEARLKVLQEQGLIRVAEGQGEEPKPEVFDPAKHNLMTMDHAARLIDAEGEAIARVQDLTAEYSELFPGKSLRSYVGQPDSNGMTPRGMVALRREALAQKKDLFSYVAEKFKFGERRAEIAAAAAAEREAAIRKDERAKAIAEIGNPALRPPSASSNPFLPAGKDAAGKMPWENAEERSAARLSKALTHVLGAN